MKKTFATISGIICLSILISVSARAETKGSYVGLNLIDARLKYHEVATRNTYSAPITYAEAVNNDIGFGLSYKYAFNFNKIFIAPGMFFDKLNASTHRGPGSSVSDPYPSLNRLTIRNRYGVSMDLGYDLMDKISPYITGGYSRMDYVSENYTTQGGVPRSRLDSSNVGDWYYGFGVRSKINEKFSLAFEYSTQKFRASSLTYDNRDYDGVYRSKLELFKLGVFYNF